jgi:hypothetical protein
MGKGDDLTRDGIVHNYSTQLFVAHGNDNRADVRHGLNLSSFYCTNSHTLFVYVGDLELPLSRSPKDFMPSYAPLPILKIKIPQVKRHLWEYRAHQRLISV